MREEIQLLKQWLEAPLVVEKHDPIVEAILHEPPVVDEPTEQENVIDCTDTADDLVKVFRRITRPHKRAFIQRLHDNKHRFLSSSGKPHWVEARDIPAIFDMKKAPGKNNAYMAWVLSNQTGSGQYFGEWFERGGKRQKNGKFRTKQYRLRPEALEALERLFGGKHAYDCQRHKA